MELSQKTIDEINKYTSPKNMLVVNVAGIKRLDVPIKVQCVRDIGLFKAGMRLNVTAVKLTVHNELLYEINGRFQLYNCFMILG